MPQKPSRPVRGFPAAADRVKVVPAVERRAFDRMTVAEAHLVRSREDPAVMGGSIQYVRFRQAAGGIEVDPDWELFPAGIDNIYALAAEGGWPEAKAFVEAAEALAARIAREQGIA